MWQGLPTSWVTKWYANVDLVVCPVTTSNVLQSEVVYASLQEAVGEEFDAPEPSVSTA